MTETLWFTTKSNGVLRHALTADDRAECNRRIRPHEFPVRDSAGATTHYANDGRPERDLPEYAKLCDRCRAVVAAVAYATRDRFSDWEEDGAELELIDNADSISITTRLAGESGTVELDVRIRPDDLDRLERRIREIRQARGI